LRAEKQATEPKKSADSKHSAGRHLKERLPKKSLVSHWNARDLKNLPQNTGSTSSARCRVLTVRSKSLAAGFATGNNYTRAAECNRRLPLDERAPNVPFKFGFRAH
jgi:hypothetical protein